VQNSRPCAELQLMNVTSNSKLIKKSTAMLLLCVHSTIGRQRESPMCMHQQTSNLTEAEYERYELDVILTDYWKALHMVLS
jgi:hypothetical protein